MVIRLMGVNKNKLSILKYILVSVIFIILLSCESLANAYFLRGPEFNETVSNAFSGDTIEYIKWSDSAPVDEDGAILVSKTSGSAIYAWYNESDKTMYMHTEDDDIRLEYTSSKMFDGETFSNVKDLDFLSIVDSKDVRWMNEMFSGMKNVTSLEPLRDWNTSKTINMYKTFYHMSSITSLEPLANWDTSNVESLGDCFYGDSKITKLDGLEGWDTSKVKSASHLFYKLKLVNSLEPLTYWDTSSLTDMGSMFSGMKGVTSLNGLQNWDTSNVTNMGYTFSKMTGVTSLEPLGAWNTRSLSVLKHTFEEMTGVTSLDGLQNWDISNVTSLENTFFKMENVTDISAVAGWDTSKVENLAYAFSNMSNLESIKALKTWNVENVTDFSGVFLRDYKIKTLEGLEDWDVSKSETFLSMFTFLYDCTDISAVTNWDVGNSTDFKDMFCRCRSVTSIEPLRNWDMSKAENISGMLIEITTDSLDPLAGWDLANVTNSDNMLSEMKVKHLNLSSFNSDNINFKKLFHDKGVYTYPTGIVDLTPPTKQLISQSDFNSILSNVSDDATWTIDGVGGKYDKSAIYAKYKENVQSNLANNTNNIIKFNVFNTMDYEATFCSGEKFNIKLGELVQDAELEYIRWSNEPPVGDYVTVSRTSSECEIKAWYVAESNTVYLYTDAGNIYLNETSGNLLRSSSASNDNDDYVSNVNLSKLKDIQFLSSVDSSKCNSLYKAFYGLSSVSSIEPIRNWDVSKCNHMDNLFGYMSSLTSLEPLEDWDVSSCYSMDGIFYNVSNVESLEPLKNWNVSLVSNLGSAFEYMSKLKSLSGLEDWNVSSVTNLYGTFKGDKLLSSLEPLSGWNVINCTNFDSMFNGLVNITDLSPISNWNTANVKLLKNVFRHCEKIQSLEPLKNWNVSSVENLEGAFAYTYLVKDVNALSNWNIGNNTSLKETFYNMKGLTDISGISGWNTGKVTTIEDIFKGCKLSSFENISGWNLSKVINASGAFYGNIISENYLTSMEKLTSCDNMFNGTTLTKLDISGYNKVSSFSKLLGSSHTMKIEEFTPPIGKLMSQSEFNYILRNVDESSVFKVKEYNNAVKYTLAEIYELHKSNVESTGATKLTFVVTEPDRGTPTTELNLTANLPVNVEIENYDSSEPLEVQLYYRTGERFSFDVLLDEKVAGSDGKVTLYGYEETLGSDIVAVKNLTDTTVDIKRTNSDFQTVTNEFYISKTSGYSKGYFIKIKGHSKLYRVSPKMKFGADYNIAFIDNNVTVTDIDEQAHFEPDTDKGYIYPINISFKVPTDQNLGKFVLYMPNGDDDLTGADFDYEYLYKAYEVEADADGNVTFPTIYSCSKYSSYEMPNAEFIRPVVVQVDDKVPKWSLFYNSDILVESELSGLYNRGISMDDWSMEGFKLVYIYDADIGTSILEQYGYIDANDRRNKEWKKNIDIEANVSDLNNVGTGKFKLYDENDKLLGIADVVNGVATWTVVETWEEVNSLGGFAFVYDNKIYDKQSYLGTDTYKFDNEKKKTYKIVQDTGTDASVAYDKTETPLVVTLKYTGDMIFSCEAETPTIQVNNIKLQKDIEISKQAPAGRYGIYNENKELIVEVETDNNDIFTAVLNIIKGLADKITFYIKQLEIFDESLNVDNEFKKFNINVATDSEISLKLTVDGLDEIEFNNTKKQATPSEIPIDSEKIEIEVEGVKKETVDLDEKMSEAVVVFNTLEYINNNYEDEYFKRSLKTKNLTSKYKYTFEDSKNLHIDIKENEEDADLVDLSMYTDNGTSSIELDIPDSIQTELVDAGITDNKVYKIALSFKSDNNGNGNATPSEIPKDNEGGNTGNATPSEIPKDNEGGNGNTGGNDSGNTGNGNATPSEIPKDNGNESGNTGNESGSTENKSGNTDKNDDSENSGNKSSKKDDSEDRKPAYDGDWFNLEGKNINSRESKSGGAKFKIWQTNMYIRDEKRTLPIHGRSGYYRTYQFDKNGELIYGWYKDRVTHKWHYFGEDGAEVYGWQFIDGKWYFFNDDMSSINRGEMFSNCTYKGCKLGEDGALIK